MKGSEQKNIQAKKEAPNEPANVNPFLPQNFTTYTNPLFSKESSSKIALASSESDNPFLAKQTPVQKIMSPVKEKKKSELELLFNPFANYNPDVMPKKV